MRVKNIKKNHGVYLYNYLKNEYLKIVLLKKTLNAKIKTFSPSSKLIILNEKIQLRKKDV